MGNWTLNDKTKILSLIQQMSKNYPTLIKLRIIKLTKNEFVAEGNDIENSKLIIYSVPKN